MGLGESVCVESPLRLVGTWDLLLTQRALITSLGTLLLPRGTITSCLQYSVLDVSCLEFKSPGLALRLLRVSKGPLRFKLGTLPIFYPYRPPETLPLLPLFCKLLWKLREEEVRDAQACLASSPQRVYGRLGPFASSNNRPGAACSPAQTWGLHYAQGQHGPGRVSSSPGSVSRLEPETPLGTRSTRL